MDELAAQMTAYQAGSMTAFEALYAALASPLLAIGQLLGIRPDAAKFRSSRGMGDLRRLLRENTRG